MKPLLPTVVIISGLVVIVWALFYPEVSDWSFFGGITVVVIGLVARFILGHRRLAESSHLQQPQRLSLLDVVLLVLAIVGIVVTVRIANDPIIFFPPPFLLTWLGGGWLLARASQII